MDPHVGDDVLVGLPTVNCIIAIDEFLYGRFSCCFLSIDFDDGHDYGDHL
jgi:hypothetical protein